MFNKEFTDAELAKIHAKALSNYKYSADFWNMKNQRHLKDVEFATANQWDDSDLRYRDQDDKPTLTINMVNRFYERITNAFKKLQLEIKVNPQDTYKDKENSQILQGLVKCIEMDSSADVAYATANEFQTSAGYGFVRVINEYEDDTGFDQVIKIMRVKDPYSVMLDPNFKTIDGSDAKFGFIIEDQTTDEFEEQYGDDEEAIDFPANPSELQAQWFGEKVRVAEYYLQYKETTKLLLLSDGTEVYEDEYYIEPDPELPAPDPKAPKVPKEEFQGLSIMAKREIERTCVYWFKMNGVKILDYTRIPTKFIPIIIFLGKEVINGLSNDFYGITQYLRDLQRSLNYCSSLKNELIALAPKAPWVVAEGTTEKYGDMWDNANTQNFSRLPYTPKQLDNGQQAPAPFRTPFSPDISGLMANEMQIIEQMKAITGIYDIADASNMPQDQSGKAVILRQESTENINITYIFNAKKSIEYVGKIIADMAPHIYGSKQFLRIVGNDDSVKQVKVPPSLFDYNLSRFDLTITTGKSYSNLQSETADQWLSLLQYMPQTQSPLIMDQIIGNLNIKGSEVAQARLLRSIPPEILGSDQDTMSPDQMKAIIASQKQSMDEKDANLAQLTKKVEDKTAELDNKVKVAQIDSETKKFIAELESRTRMADIEVKTEAQVRVAQAGVIEQHVKQGENLFLNETLPSPGEALANTPTVLPTGQIDPTPRIDIPPFQNQAPQAM